MHTAFFNIQKPIKHYPIRFNHYWMHYLQKQPDSLSPCLGCLSLGREPGITPRGRLDLEESLICSLVTEGRPGSTILVGWLYRLEYVLHGRKRYSSYASHSSLKGKLSADNNYQHMLQRINMYSS